MGWLRKISEPTVTANEYDTDNDEDEILPASIVRQVSSLSSDE